MFVEAGICDFGDSAVKTKTLLKLASLMILICCSTTGGQTIVYDDGQSHVLSERAESVVVTNGSSLDLQANVQNVEVNRAGLVVNDGGEWDSL